MNILLPFMLFQQPTKQMMNDMGFTNKFHLKIGTRVANNIWMRTRLGEAQNWRCAWCGCDTVSEPGHANSMTIEHVIPKSKGGLCDWDNYVMACGRCNMRRGTLDVDEFLSAVDDHHPSRRQTRQVIQNSQKRLKGYLKRLPKIVEKGLDVDDWIMSLRLTPVHRSLIIDVKVRYIGCQDGGLGYNA